MKHRLQLPRLLLALGSAAAILGSCASTPDKSFHMVQSAVFEVVQKKPSDDALTYADDIDWSKVPYAIRTDEYNSIGTAFAVSGTELMTAFHVIDLGYRSLVYDAYYIRDASGAVFEVDKITGGSNEKDYLTFTVKGRTFNEWYAFDMDYKIGDAVYSVGNALGEGIVVRNGLILGTVPEEKDGRWNMLKSSADGNPGNSGGPLITASGKVVALVTALRDNILYSVPASVIAGDGADELDYRITPRYGHLLLANRMNSEFEAKIPLPDTPENITRLIGASYEKHYDAEMSRLFTEAPSYLEGPANAWLLSSVLSSSFPQLSFVDSNDDNWKLSGLEARSVPLPDDGSLFYADVAGYRFYKIKRPLSSPIAKISGDPKYIMDLILGNIRTDRRIYGGDKYRILSYGEPAGREEYRDPLGRTWMTAWWKIGYSDEVLLMYVLPLPNGPAVITTTQYSELKFDYEWDMRKICDHVCVAWEGAFDEWDNFIRLEDNLPDFLRGLRFSWDPAAKSFALGLGSWTVALDSSVLDWANDSEIYLAPSWYKTDGELRFGVRKAIFNRDMRGNEYVILFKNLLPDPKLGAGALQNWNDIVARKFPFDGKPAVSEKDNTGSVGAVLDGDFTTDDALVTLYLEVQDPGSAESLSRRFGSLKQGITYSSF
jgi:hypothetical protein